MDEIIQWKVTRVIFETYAAITLILEPYPDKKAIIQYKAGQFLTFLFTIKNREVRRSYSISSSPETDTHFSVTVKKVINGEVSNHIFKYVGEGSVLTSLFPAGRFILEENNTYIPKDYFFICAGSGITPVFSMVKTLLALKSNKHITLIYSNSTQRSTLFFSQLKSLQNAFPDNLSCIFFFSNSDDRANSYDHRGHLNIEMLQRLIRLNVRYAEKDAEFYLCGPFTFMRMSDMVIVFMGFDEDKIHKENFVIRLETVSENFIDSLTPIDKSLTFYDKGHESKFSIPFNKTILQTALENNIKIPYSCKAGICGSCAALCVEGEVRMSVNEVLTSKDLKQKLVLTCVGYVYTDTVSISIL